VEDDLGGLAEERGVLSAVTSFCTWAVRLEPAILSLIGPLVLLRPKVGAVLLLAVPAVWVCRYFTTGHFVGRTPLDAAIALLLTMALVTLGVTPAPDLTLPRVLALVWGIAVFYAVEGHVRGERALLMAVGVYLILGAAIAGAGILGTNWLYKLPALGSLVGRLPAVLRGLPGAEAGFHPNEVAGTLAWFVPLQVALLAFWLAGRWDAGHGRLAGGLLVGSAGLTLLTLVLTQSRGGWAGVAVALLALLASLGRRGALFAGGLALLALVAAALIGPARLMEALSDDLAQVTVGRLNFPFRLELWRVALCGIADFPFTGMGLGAFRRVARLLYPLNIDPDYPFGHAHNHLLHTGVELGIPGLIAYLALWLLAAWMVVEACRRTQGWRRALAVGAGGALVAYFVYGITDAVALGAKPGVVFWYLLGLIVALHRLAVGPAAGPLAATEGRAE
jgi:putative inorganic carbon (HCO3(-)) transporter